MESSAKHIQFAKLANLSLVGESENQPEYVGTKEDWKTYENYLAKDDRGEFQRYPWQSIPF